MRSQESLLSEKAEVEKELQLILKTSPDIVRIKNLRKKKTSLTRILAVYKGREKKKYTT